MNKYIEKMTGYKATDKDMRCQGHQFALNVWSEIEGELELCKRGFHFCVHPSGVWDYYSAPGTRVFKVECEQMLEVPTEAGASFKLVAKRIRLIAEITPGLTGNDKSNTGDSNTGNRNTGDRNTGNWNTGHRNTGDRNTGNWNTGHRNIGNWNIGNWNTGDRNIGNWNTGDSNTGDRNTGNWNTGDRNTGNWNTANRSSGFFAIKEPTASSFGIQTKLTFEQYLEKYPEAYRLGELLEKPDAIPFSDFKRIPGITKAKLKQLHEAFLKAKARKV